MSGVEGRIAWISASSSGLGLACASALAKAGATVFINGRDEDRLEAARQEIVATSPDARVVTVAADLTTDAGIDRAVEACPAPDILINNNRGPKSGGFDEITDDDVREALELHLWAPLHLVRAHLPGMRQRRFGRIVNITSAMVASPRNTQFASTAPRAAFSAMMKALQHEVVADNVTINQVLPYRIDSPRQVQNAQREVAQERISYEEARRRQAVSVAAGRLGAPYEFAHACLFLCDEDAGFISGLNVRVDGGSYTGLL